MVEDPEAVLSQYALIGCKFVAVPYLNEDLRPGTEKFPEVIVNVAKIGAVAKKLGMTLLYHNHDFEFMKLDGKYALEVLYDTIPADLLQTELDTCWVNVGGEEPAAYVRKFTDRAPVVHLKDFHGEKSEDMYELIGIEKKAPARPGNFEFRPVGSGLQDIPAILAAADEAGATWYIVEQDNPSMGLTPLECAKKSAEYLLSL
jgi:sugar phosphate isomerase/epimerase